MKVSRFFPFFAAIIWFSLLISWIGFADPDAFYHAKTSLLLWQFGPIHDFPWLDLTQLGTQYADLHFGFHAFVAPFASAFGMLQGLRIASVLLAAMFATAFVLCLRTLNVRHVWVWTLLLLTSQPLLIRLLLAKATPLALLWYIFGLTAAWKRKPWFVALATLGFSLSHGGWMYLAGSIVLLMFGDWMFGRVVLHPRRQTSFVTEYIKPMLAGFAGGFLGLFIHPNFPNTFAFSWTQVVTIGLGTPFQRVTLGVEWAPTSVADMIVGLAPWLIAAVLGCIGLVLARRDVFDEERARLVTSVGCIVAVLVALTFKSARTVEYLVPVLAIWCAAVWSMVDVRLYTDSVLQSLSFLGRTVRRVVPVVLIACAAMLFFRQTWTVWKLFHEPRFSDTVYQTTMSEISVRAKPDDRVFHSSWDEFPMLFAFDDRLRYVSGLDPTFLFVASSTLSDDVRDLTWRTASSTTDAAWELIHDRLNSKFVFVTKRNHMDLLKLIQRDARYVPLAESDDSASFEVVTTSTAPVLLNNVDDPLNDPPHCSG